MAAKIGRPPAPVIPRLADRLSIGHESGCWIWEGARNPAGYGLICIEGKNRLVHRVTYEMFRGPIPGGKILDHLCRNRACAWPGHLDVVDHAMNIARGMAPAAVAHRNGTCQRGVHDMTDVYVTKGGRRQCRPCQLDRAAERRGEKG